MWGVEPRSVNSAVMDGTLRTDLGRYLSANPAHSDLAPDKPTRLELTRVMHLTQVRDHGGAHMDGPRCPQRRPLSPFGLSQAPPKHGVI